MKIERVKVANYRNIDGIDVWMDSLSNYIIGENNLGKSNFLKLLLIVCNGKSFVEDDYSDSQKAIEVEIQIKMDINEIGFFGDNFDSNDKLKIHLKYIQLITEAYPKLICTDTEESLPIKKIKKLNYFCYESTAIPQKELQFTNLRGLGLVSQKLISSYVETKTPDFFNNGDIDGLKDYLNTCLGKIRGFKAYGLEASVSNDNVDMIRNLFYLSDGERKIDNAGAGIQYTAMASVAILSHIMNLYVSKTSLFEERLYQDTDGNKILPIILAVDEPEVHLHPYLQRSLIRYYKRILTNKDSDFLDLLKMCFGIDRLDGQLIVVTHSTDSLSDNYHNIIRFYKEGGKIEIASGASPNFVLPTKEKKQLFMRFHDIKAAFYAHVVILIEGETEYGCIPFFAEKMGICLDEYSICVINAQGESNIKPLQALFSNFGIKSVAIYDGDVKDGKTCSDMEFFSDEPCFEFELVKKMCNINKKELLKEIFTEIYSKALTEVINSDFIKKPYTKKLGLDINNYKERALGDIPENDPEFYNVFSSWLYSKKGVLTGRIVGNMVGEFEIPKCYKRAIQKAKEVAES